MKQYNADFYRQKAPKTRKQVPGYEYLQPEERAAVYWKALQMLNDSGGVNHVLDVNEYGEVVTQLDEYMSAICQHPHTVASTLRLFEGFDMHCHAAMEARITQMGAVVSDVRCSPDLKAKLFPSEQRVK